MITRFASPLLNLTLGLALAGLSGMALANPPKIDTSTLTVIGYHEITDTKNALIPQYAVTTQQFTEHVDWLQKWLPFYYRRPVNPCSSGQGSTSNQASFINCR
ncbi:hypothetical protein AB3538_01380 [Acinetobacter baumannii]